MSMALESDKIESDNLFKDIVVTTEEDVDDDDLVYLPSDDSDAEEFLDQSQNLFGSSHLKKNEIIPINQVEIKSSENVKKERADEEDVNEDDIATQPYYDPERDESMRDLLRIPEIQAILEDPEDFTEDDFNSSQILDIPDSEIISNSNSPASVELIGVNCEVKQTEMYTTSNENSQASDCTIVYNLDDESTHTSNTICSVVETVEIPVTKDENMPLIKDVLIESPPVAVKQPKILPDNENIITHIKSSLSTKELIKSTAIVDPMIPILNNLKEEQQEIEPMVINNELAVKDGQLSQNQSQVNLENPEDTLNAAAEPLNSSHLTEHAYSQNENPDLIPNEEFYDNCISQVVGPGGNCTVLGEFAELMLNYFGEDFANSECSVFLKNMKKKIDKMKQIKEGVESSEKEEPQPGTSRAAIMEDLLDAIIQRPSDIELLETKIELEDSIIQETMNISILTQDVYTMDTQPLIINNYESMEIEDNQEEIFEGPEPEVPSFLLCLDKFSNLIQQASETIRGCESSQEVAQISMNESIRTLKLRFRDMISGFDPDTPETQDMETQTDRKKRTHEEKKKLNAKYKHLLGAQSSSEESIDSDSDYEQFLNLKHAKQKPPETEIPEISSTLPESPEVSFADKDVIQTVEVETTNKEKDESSSAHSSDLDGGDSEEDIDKLINFDGLEKVILDVEKGSGLGPRRKHKKKKKPKKNDEIIKESQDPASSESSESEQDDEQYAKNHDQKLNDDMRKAMLASTSESGSSTSDSDTDNDSDAESDNSLLRDKFLEGLNKEAKGNSIDNKDETDVEDAKVSTTDQKDLSPKAGPSPKIDSDVDSVKSNKSNKSPKKSVKPAEASTNKSNNNVAIDPSLKGIFSKRLLEDDANSNSKEKSVKSKGTSKKRVKENGDAASSDSDNLDLSMFEHKRARKEQSLTDFFQKTDKPVVTSTASTSSPAPGTSKQKSVDDDCFILSSDSEVESVTEPADKKRGLRQMLTHDQLAEETKKAQKEETERIKRLDKKNSMLTQILDKPDSQQENITSDLVLDFDQKRKIKICVHPQIVCKLKEYQKEGVKFMYDTIYGGVDYAGKHKGSGAILAHCMGLGKTLQLIALLHTLIRYPQLKTSRVLVICPKSTVMNWSEEINKWVGPIAGTKLKVFYFQDAILLPRKLDILRDWYNSDHKRAGVMLIGYEALKSLVDQKKKKHPISDVDYAKVKKYLLEPGADLVVCDEGHIIKNAKTSINYSVSQITTLKRIVLTGTPIQNNLTEYYCMVNFIKPSFLGTQKEFNNLYANPIKEGQHKDSSKMAIKLMKQRSYVLNKKLSKFVQRKEAAVLKDFLPQKFEYCLYVPLTPTQTKLYVTFLKNNPLNVNHGGKNLLPDYTFLRKIWTHPKVLDVAYKNAEAIKQRQEAHQRRMRKMNNDDFDTDSEPDDINDTNVTMTWWRDHVTPKDMESILPSNKLIILFEILKMCAERQEKCLIFSAFVAVLNMVEHFMKLINDKSRNPLASEYGLDNFHGPYVMGQDYLRLDGKTSKSVRHQMVKTFNDTSNKKMRVFLISAKAGGQGINLFGANRCIILDTSWNPANDQQNIFRIYRLGQPKKCYVYRLLAMNTMEEKIYSRSVTKQAMSFRVVDKQQVGRHYNMADLAELYDFNEEVGERPTPNLPQDDILANLLIMFPDRLYKYHEHDSLLEDKPEEGLSEADKNEAWAAYESDLKNSHRMPHHNAFNGFNDVMAANFNSYFNFNGSSFGYPSVNGLNMSYSPFSQIYNSLTYAGMPGSSTVAQDNNYQQLTQMYRNSMQNLSSINNYGSILPDYGDFELMRPPPSNLGVSLGMGGLSGISAANNAPGNQMLRLQLNQDNSIGSFGTTSSNGASSSKNAQATQARSPSAMVGGGIIGVRANELVQSSRANQRAYLASKASASSTATSQSASSLSTNLSTKLPAIVVPSTSSSVVLGRKVADRVLNNSPQHRTSPQISVKSPMSINANVGKPTSVIRPTATPASILNISSIASNTTNAISITKNPPIIAKSTPNIPSPSSLMISSVVSLQGSDLQKAVKTTNSLQTPQSSFTSSQSKSRINPYSTGSVLKNQPTNQTANWIQINQAKKNEAARILQNKAQQNQKALQQIQQSKAVTQNLQNKQAAVLQQSQNQIPQKAAPQLTPQPAVTLHPRKNLVQMPPLARTSGGANIIPVTSSTTPNFNRARQQNVIVHTPKPATTVYDITKVNNSISSTASAPTSLLTTAINSSNVSTLISSTNGALRAVTARKSTAKPLVQVTTGPQPKMIISPARVNKNSNQMDLSKVIRNGQMAQGKLPENAKIRTVTMSKDQFNKINEQLKNKVVQSPPKGMTITRVVNKTSVPSTVVNLNTSTVSANSSTPSTSSVQLPVVAPSIIKKSSVDVKRLMLNNRAISIKPVANNQNQSIQSAGNQNAAAFANISRKRTIINPPQPTSAAKRQRTLGLSMGRVQAPTTAQSSNSQQVVEIVEIE